MFSSSRSTEELASCALVAELVARSARSDCCCSVLLAIPMRTTNADHCLSTALAPVPSFEIASAMLPSAPPAPGVPVAICETDVGTTERPSAAGLDASMAKKSRPVAPVGVDPVLCTALTR